MENRITRPLVRFFTLLLPLAGAAMLLSAPQPGALADAGHCTRAGTLTTINGKVACDCSSTINKGDCSCIYSCGNLEE